MTIIDLGCGRNKTEGAIGVDLRALPGVDIVHDLDLFPYPFGDNSADEIRMNHVLEHVPEMMRVMEEIWRVLKPGGLLHIRVPHCTGMLAWKDPTHRRSFTTESFEYFGGNAYSYYTEARFRILSRRLVYRLGQGSWLQKLFDWRPTFAERHLSYLLGGIDELQVTL